MTPSRLCNTGAETIKYTVLNLKLNELQQMLSDKHKYYSSIVCKTSNTRVTAHMRMTQIKTYETGK